MKFSFFSRHSIKTKVTLLTLIIFVVSLWTLSYYASRMLQDDLQRMLGEQQFSTASLVAEHINDALDERRVALELVAGQIDAQLIGRPTVLQAHLEQHQILARLFNGGVFATGADGTAIAEMPLFVGRIGTNYMDRESVSVPLKDGKTVIGRPAMGKKLGAPIFSITAPVRDGSGEVIGTLVGTINLGLPNFLDHITRTAYGKHGSYLLVAPAQRMVITASDKRRALEVLPAAGVSPTLDRFIGGHEGSEVFVNPLGLEVLASVKSVPVAGWYFAVVMPTADAFAPIHAMQQRMLWITLALTLLAGALTWWTLRRQLAPMLVGHQHPGDAVGVRSACATSAHQQRWRNRRPDGQLQPVAVNAASAREEADRKRVALAIRSRGRRGRPVGLERGDEHGFFQPTVERNAGLCARRDRRHPGRMAQARAS